MGYNGGVLCVSIFGVASDRRPGRLARFQPYRRAAAALHIAG